MRPIHQPTLLWATVDIPVRQSVDTVVVMQSKQPKVHIHTMLQVDIKEYSIYISICLHAFDLMIKMRLRLRPSQWPTLKPQDCADSPELHEGPLATELGINGTHLTCFKLCPPACALPRTPHVTYIRTNWPCQKCLCLAFSVFGYREPKLHRDRLTSGRFCIRPSDRYCTHKVSMPSNMPSRRLYTNPCCTLKIHLSEPRTASNHGPGK